MLNISERNRLFLKNNVIFILVTVIASAMPFCMLMVPGGASICFFLMLGLAIIFFLRNKKWPKLTHDRGYPWFLIGLILLASVMLLQMGVMGSWSGRNFEPIIRFLSGILLLPFLACLPSSFLKKIDWGVIVAAIAAFIYAIVAVFIWSQERAANYFTCAITFGNVSLLLGFWSLASICWDSNSNRCKKSFKFIAFFVGMYASFLAGSRGGWVAIPLLILILWDLFRKNNVLSKKELILFFIACVLHGIVSVNLVSSRVNEAVSNLNSYKQWVHHKEEIAASSPENPQPPIEHPPTSLGHRFELWKGAIFIFKQHPVLGIGKGKFQEGIKQLAAQGVITNQVTTYDHAHNEVLFMMAEFGFVGLVILLLFYFCTFIQFYKYRKDNDLIIKTASHLGLLLIVGYIVFGFTEVVFVKVKEISFLVMMVCIFLGIIAGRMRELRYQSKYYSY